MFQTDSKWENFENIKFIRSLFQQPGLHQYAIIELPINFKIIHVDILLKGDAEATGVYSRYLVTNLAMAIRILSQSDCSNSFMNIQTRDNNENTYSINPIAEIVSALNLDGSSYLLYRLRNGNLYNEENSHVLNEAIVVKELLWAEISNHKSMPPN